MYKKFSIVIVNKDLKLDTSECVDSLQKAGASLEKIVIVDNGSRDDSVRYLKERYGNELNVIEAKENFGYPYGLNLGVNFFVERGAEWLILMNNDTVVANDFLKVLEKTVNSKREYLLFAPMILYYDLPKTIWFMGAKIIPGTLLFTNEHRGMLDSKKFPDVIPVDFVHGCAMIVHKSVFELIGLFDDTSPIYGDDVDFSWRARSAGFKMAAIPDAKLWHKVSAFMQKHKPKTRYLRIRNQIWFYRKYSKGFQLPLMALFTFLKVLWIFFLDILNWQPELILPLFHGWLDGWKGKGNREYA
jgi:GT2 family glycosyltransferase